MRHTAFTFVGVLAALAMTACGGMPGAGGGGKSSYEQLKAMPDELQAEVDALLKPIDDLNAAADQLGELPTKLKLNAADFKNLVQAKLDGKETKLPESLDEQAKTELETFLKTVVEAKSGLMALPEKAPAVVASIAAKLPEIAVLAGKVAAEAKITQANPLASADDKKKAKEQADGVGTLQTEITAKIDQIKTKVTGVPQLGTEALAKFTAALAGGGAPAGDGG